MNLDNAIHPLHVIAAALKRSGLAEAVLIGNSSARGRTLNRSWTIRSVASAWPVVPKT